MIAKCRHATRRHPRLTWCTEVIAVNAVVTDTAVDTGRTKASIGMAISTAPNPAALRTANAPVITSMKKTRPNGDRDDTLQLSDPASLPFAARCDMMMAQVAAVYGAEDDEIEVPLRRKG